MLVLLLVVHAVLLVVLLVVLQVVLEVFFLEGGCAGQFLNVNSFASVGLGAVCGVRHVGLLGHHFSEGTRMQIHQL